MGGTISVTSGVSGELAQARFTRRLALLVGLGFVALLVAGVTTVWLQLRNEQSGRWVEHTLDVETRIGEFASANERAETARRGVLLGGGQGFRLRMESAADQAAATLDQLAVLTIDNPVQQRRLAELRRLIVDQRAIQRRALARAGTDWTEAALEADPAVQQMRRMRTIADAMLTDERELLARRNDEQEATLRTFYAILIVTGALFLGVAATTITVLLRYTRALSESQQMLRALNEDLEGMVAVRTSELERANQEIQRFAYIVSHDLRSPLVNVMGFTAELDAARKTVAGFLDRLEAQAPEQVDPTVRTAVVEDLPEAIGFIRSSTQKMDRLINAILRLSREGRRTLAPERIDMNALVGGIIDSIRHRVTEVGATIEAGPLPDIINDRVAIEQILSNLVENAVKYLSPSRPGFIRVTGREERDRVLFEVSDNGRGIDPRDHERIFDLFRRSGTQDQPGEGIGLAHVRALAYRLGGLIEVKSALDQGSTFRLSLPKALKPGGEDA